MLHLHFLIKYSLEIDGNTIVIDASAVRQLNKVHRSCQVELFDMLMWSYKYWNSDAKNKSTVQSFKIRML